MHFALAGMAQHHFLGVVLRAHPPPAPCASTCRSCSAGASSCRCWRGSSSSIRGLELDIRLQDGYVDLVKDGIDLAIRVGALQDSSLVARRFASQTLLLVASPDYLARQGHPASLRALARHRAILFRMPTSGRDRPWQFVQRGHAVTIQPRSQLRLNDGEAMVQAALLGVGLAQLPDYMAADPLGDGRLVELLPSLRPQAMPISAVYPSQRLLPPRVRVLLDALTAL